jgi:acyl-CoA synthetase (AMP-forming)/AMP-acid ligase II
MLYKTIEESHKKKGGEEFIVSENKNLEYSEAKKYVDRIAAGLLKRNVERLYLYRVDPVWGLLALSAAEKVGVDASVLSADYSKSQVSNAVNRVGDGLVLQNVTKIIAGGEKELVDTGRNDVGHLVVFTTGTTGPPKAVRYRWENLLSQGRIRSGEEESRWLLFYPLSHFAGIQVLVHVLKNKSTLVIPDSRGHEDVLQAIRDHQVTAVSATPTFWRLFAGRISSKEAQTLSLKHITLGGEAATRDVLDQLKRLFPDASISHVYATTEVGSCFSVRDGKPGFPKEFLNRTVGNVDIKVEDDKLYVRASNSMEGYVGHEEEIKEGWFATGDLVEIGEERVFFRGRTSNSINVGGVKVYPLKVEEVILSVPGVQTARARGEPNPITGEVVAVDVEPSQGADKEDLKKRVKSECENKLNRYEQPRKIRVVNHIERKNEKITRQ